jgi:hypothetical protein
MGFVVFQRRELVFLWFAVAAMVAARLAMAATNFDPQYDQSMLLANFPLGDPAQLFRPLPYFEQTTTLGHGSLLDGLARVLGPEGMARVNAIRLISASAFCASLLWLYFLLRGALAPTEALLSVALVGSSPAAMAFSVDSKHYVFEFVATIVLLGAALNYLRRPGWRRGFLVVLAGAFVALFSFVAPIAIAAVGTATLVAQLVDGWQRKLAARQVWATAAGTLALGAVLVAIAAAFYLKYTRVVTVSDLAAFAERDALTFIEVRNPLSQQSLRVFLEYLTYFFRFVEIGADEVASNSRLKRLFMAVPVLALFVLGIMVLRRRAPFWAVAALVAPVVTLLFNLAQVMPLSGVRQHLFAAPLIAPVIVVGFVSAARWAASRLAVPRAADGVFALTALAGIAFSAVGPLYLKGTVSALMDEMDASGAPVWAFYGAQPILRTMRPGWMADGSAKVEGLLSHQTGSRPWGRQARADDDSGMRPDYYASAAETISKHDRLWLVFANWHFDVARTEGLEVFIRHARGPGRDCAVWYNKDSTLVAYCGPADDVAAMRQRTPPDRNAEWEALIRPGEWIRFVKGETGEVVRDSGS